MKQCRYCGTAFDDSGNFCPACGQIWEPFQAYVTPQPEKSLAGAHVLGVFFAMLIFVLLIVETVLYLVSSITKPKFVAEQIRDIKVSELTFTIREKGKEKEVNLAEMIMERLDEDKKEEFGASVERIDRFLDESNVTDFVADKVTEYMNYLNGDGPSPSIEKKEIMDLVKENSDKVEAIFGYQITEEDYQKLNDTLDEMELEQFSGKNLEKEYGPGIEGVRSFLSVNYRGYVLGLIAVLIVLLLLIFTLKGKFYWALFHAGMPTLLAGAAMFAGGKALAMLPALLENEVELSEAMVEIIFGQIGRLILAHSRLLLLCGIGMILGFIVFKLLLSARRQKVQDTFMM